MQSDLILKLLHMGWSNERSHL